MTGEDVYSERCKLHVGKLIMLIAAEWVQPWRSWTTWRKLRRLTRMEWTCMRCWWVTSATQSVSDCQSVCLSVCLSATNSASHADFSYLHISYISSPS